MTNDENTSNSEVQEFDEESAVSWRDILSSQYVASLALVCLAVWLHAADSLIVATMLPDIVADIGGAPLVGWSVALYELGSIIAGAAAALLTMRHGLRTPMACSAAFFGLGCLVSAIAPTMPILLAGRLMQGLGGGGLVAMGFVAISVLFPRRYVARAMAAVSTLWGVSSFLGPLIGGIFVEFASWRWGFAFFGAQAALLALWIASRGTITRPPQNGASSAIPVGRLALLSLGVLAVAYAGVEVTLFRTSVLVVLGLVFLALFLALDDRAGADRLLPKKPVNFRRPAGAALVMVFSVSAATIALTAFGPLFMTAIHGISPLSAGYVIACSSIGWTFAALLFSGSPECRDGKMIAAGMTIVTASIAGLAYAIPSGPIWLIALFATLEGGGFGLAWTFILRRTTALSPSTEAERIAGAIPTIQRLGYAVGAAYIGIVANASGLVEAIPEIEAAYVARQVFVACLPFAALGLMAMLALLQRTDKHLTGNARSHN